jgi:hypothetical protein
MRPVDDQWAVSGPISPTALLLRTALRQEAIGITFAIRDAGRRAEGR